MLYEITLDNNKLNSYKIGRISGMIHILIGQNGKQYPIKYYKDRNVCIMTFESDKDVMFEIQDAINKAYPGVIIPGEG